MKSSNSAAATSAGQPEPRSMADVLEERLIDAEYKIWKKNTPYLYDFVMTHSLEWPSLTCQWLPTEKQHANSVEHSLLLGTHTTGEQNYLMIASVHLPQNDAVLDQREMKGEGAAGSGAVSGGVSTSIKASYNEEKQELGGYGITASSTGGSGKDASSSVVGKMEIKFKVKHEGEVNRARYMPQNHFMVATRGPSSDVYIWDLSKHPSFPDPNTPFCPQAICVGHTKEGYGLGWSPHQEGRLLSGSEDTTLVLWDVQQQMSKKPANKGNNSQYRIEPLSVFKGHEAVVEDVDWHPRDAHMVGSGSDDGTVRIWDVREKNATKAVHVISAHEGSDVNCISFNPVNEFLFASGSADKTVALWDMRNLSRRMHTLEGHNDQIYQVDWAPFNESILGSCSADRRVSVWDLSRIGMEQAPEDAEDGPPELLFTHGGHTSKVSDFSWNAKDEWTIASVSEDNVLQIWNMAEEIYASPQEEEDAGEDGDDGDVLKEDDLVEE